jgi:hypothetical protein
MPLYNQTLNQPFFTEIMAATYKEVCRKCRPLLILLLFLPFYFFTKANSQAANGKQNAVTRFLENNIVDLGSRAVLLVYKGGKLVYNKKVNEFTQQ